MTRTFAKWALTGGALLTLAFGSWGLTHQAAAQNAPQVVAQTMPDGASMDQGGMADRQAMMMKKMMDARPKALKRAAATVQKVKAEALKKGMYNCCLKHPCDWCALKMGACPCGKNAAMGKPVCNECKGGWEAGDGAIPGLTADQIKTFPRGAMAMSMAAPSGMRSVASAGAAKLVDVTTCPITGEKVIGAGAGSERFAQYNVHFCCSGCQAEFDALSRVQKLQKIHAALARA
jgi:hypothetical protein